jgi:hypothetical protein
LSLALTYADVLDHRINFCFRVMLLKIVT